MTRSEKISMLIDLAKGATDNKDTIKTFVLIVDTLDCWEEAIHELSENEYNHEKLNDYIWRLVIKYRDD